MSETNLQPLVSVIVPVYNREQTVAATLTSVLESTYRPVEVMVVDDGSDDRSAQMIQDFIVANQSQDFKIRMLQQPNQGAPAARNNGLQNCSGQLVQFLDSDDLLDREKISAQVETMIHEKSDVCVCDYRVDYVGSEKSSQVVSNEHPLSKVVKGESLGCSTCLIGRELATSVTWTESLPNFQDMDYFLKVILLAKKISHLPRPLYFYQIHEDIPTISSIRKQSKAPVPYRQRLGSLLNDCILNNKYGSTFKRFTYGTYALLLLWLKSIKYRFAGS